MSRLNVRRLACVLSVANRLPPLHCREMFYRLKSHILRTFGQPTRIVHQQIEKACWGYPQFACDEGCDKCGGTGIYSRTVVEHQQWLLAGRTFLTPLRTLFGAEKQTVEIDIEGLVQHRSGKRSRVCALALLMLFCPHHFQMDISSRKGLTNFRRCLKIIAAVGVVPASQMMVTEDEFDSQGDYVPF